MKYGVGRVDDGNVSRLLVNIVLFLRIGADDLRGGPRPASQASLIAALMSADPPPVSTVQPMASPALDRLVRKCLAKSADDRWQSARDLLSELQWIADAGSQSGIPAPVASRRHRERLPWLLVGVVSALLLTSLVFTAAHLREQPAKATAVVSRRLHRRR